MGFADIHQKPLNQKVEYDMEAHLIYGRQKGYKKVIEWLLTFFGWFVLLVYAGYLIYGSLAIRYSWPLPEFLFFTKEMVLLIQQYFFILFIALLIATVLLIIWKNYNYYRFGKMHRRSFRPDVTNEELCETFELDLETVTRLQQERMVVLEENIIPEYLGMGNARHQEKEKEKSEKKGNS